MPSGGGAARDARLLLTKSRNEKTDRPREAFVLLEIEELSASEAANALHLPIGTVASRVTRARELIRASPVTRRGAL